TGRPCYEAEDSACRGEWRREAGSPREGGAQCQPGKERVANSHPPFVPARPKGRAGTYCFIPRPILIVIFLFLLIGKFAIEGENLCNQRPLRMCIAFPIPHSAFRIPHWKRTLF